MVTRTTKPIPIDLALQGGGSHGAFTWGVLDRLLDEPGLQLDGVSGTSAGALNAAVLATGLAEGGAAGAQAALRAFWLDVAGAQACFGQVPVNRLAGPFAALGPVMPPLPLAAFNLDAHPAYAWLNQFLRSVSPYQFNAFGPNALAEVARRHVRPAALQRGPLKVFITATAVQTGQPRVFSGAELTIDALLASACLPHLFKAVQIDGQPYWDGGYSGNPALWPLIYETRAADLMLVKVSPLVRPGTPDTAAEIADRVNEICFNAGLVAEMRAIHFVQRLLADKRVPAGRYKALRLHMVTDETLVDLQPSSKLNTDRAFIERLHTMGHAAASAWLDTHRAALGKRATMDVEGTYLAPRQA